MPVEIETESGRKLKGKVLTVSGGRVRVDFNHPYAGKHLVYEVEVVEKIEDPIDKVKALIELRMPMVKPEEVIIEVGEKDVSVDFSNVGIDRNTLVLGEILLESDLKFIGYEEVKLKPSVDELLKPPEKEEQVTELEEEVSEPLIEKAEEEKPAEETTETEGVKAEESEEKKEETSEGEEVKEEPETRKEEQAEEKPKKKSTKKSKTTRKRSTSAKKRKTTKKKTEKPAESAEEKTEETE